MTLEQFLDYIPRGNIPKNPVPISDLHHTNTQKVMLCAPTRFWSELPSELKTEWLKWMQRDALYKTMVITKATHERNKALTETAQQREEAQLGLHAALASRAAQKIVTEKVYARVVYPSSSPITNVKTLLFGECDHDSPFAQDIKGELFSSTSPLSLASSLHDKYKADSEWKKLWEAGVGHSSLTKMCTLRHTNNSDIKRMLGE
jgi:hypothetical protein